MFIDSIGIDILFDSVFSVEAMCYSRYELPGLFSITDKAQVLYNYCCSNKEYLFVLVVADDPFKTLDHRKDC